MLRDEDIKQAFASLTEEGDQGKALGNIQERVRSARRRRRVLAASSAVVVLLGLFGLAYSAYDAFQPEPRLVLTEEELPPGTDEASDPDGTGSQPWHVVQVTQNEYHDMVPWLDGGRLAWRARVDQDDEIMLADLSAGSLEKMTVNDLPDYEPRLAGDYLVWQDGPSEQWQLHVTNLVTGDQRDLGEITRYGTYRIAGDLLVWPDYSRPSPVAKVHRLSLGETRAVDVGQQAEVWPTTDGRDVGIYAVNDAGMGSVYVYDWESDRLKTVAEQARGLTWGSWTEDNWISGGRLVYAAREGGDLEIYLYELDSNNDLDRGLVTKLTDNDLDDFAPVIGGSTILWYQAQDAGVPGRLAGAVTPSRERTVLTLDLDSGEQRTLQGAFAWLQDDGRLAATAAWPQHWPEMHLYDLETGTDEVVSEEGYNGSWIHVADGRVTWYREEDEPDYPSAEIMLAYRGAAPKLPEGAKSDVKFVNPKDVNPSGPELVPRAPAETPPAEPLP